MANERTAYDQLVHELRQAGDIAVVLDGLSRLEALHHAGAITTRALHDAQVYAFRALQQITAEDPVDAASLIHDLLLPACALDDPDSRIPLHELRLCLRRWVDQYPAEDRQHLEEEIQHSLLPYVRETHPKGACWTISTIGLRTLEVEETLWALVRSDDGENGDVALSVIADLGLPTASRRSDASSELHRRMAERFNLSLLSTLQRLADKDSIQVVFDCWLTDDTKSLSDMDPSLVVSGLHRILDAHADDIDLADDIWRRLTLLVEQRAERLARGIYLGGIAPSCNSILVFPTLLTWLVQRPGGGTQTSWDRYLMGRRLEECVLPNQLAGASRCDNVAAIRALCLDACQDTGMDTFMSTREMDVKEMAWKTALRIGCDDALAWFDSAVPAETSRFMQDKIMTLLSAFRLDPLPEQVALWVTEPYNVTAAEKDSRELARRSAAIQVARSAASRSAFEALLHYGLTFDGKGLVKSAEALMDVASYLTQKGEIWVIDKLVETVLSGQQEHWRIAATLALEIIAQSDPLLVLPAAGDLAASLTNVTRDSYERGALIRTLGHIADWTIPDELMQRLIEWAHEPDRWIGGSSLSVLSQRGLLIAQTQLLTNVLGLNRRGETWGLDSEAQTADWAPYVIGELYRVHGEVFAPAVASIVRFSDWESVAQVSASLLAMSDGDGGQRISVEIEDALFDRIRTKQSHYYGEAEVFDLIARLAPDRLAHENWESIWDGWLPNSRVALADALGRVRLLDEQHANAIGKLQLLTGDGQYSVRRAAYRGLASQSPDSLYALCLSWSRTDSVPVDLRQRAGEACGWLPHAKMADRFEELFDTLAVDPDKAVRESVHRSRTERRNREWAMQYLTILQNIGAGDNEAVFQTWRYGDALRQIGDDTCLQFLNAYRSSLGLAPNIRYWLRWLAKEMEKAWGKVTQEWPQPWFGWHGAIEEGHGSVEFAGEQTASVQYSVWRQPASRPAEISAWGGAAWPVPDFTHTGSATLQLQGGQRGEILVTNVSGGMIVFSGNGPFPA